MTIQTLTRILGPLKTPDQNLRAVNNILSKSAKLFSGKGLVRIDDGKVTLLPLFVRAMRKLENILHEEMEKISANEVLLPTFVKTDLLNKTGRDKKELFSVVDRKKTDFVLAPTGEEAVTQLMGMEKMLREHSFPFRIYQISSKFRDESRAKHGVLRSKEFRMKDLYCFDATADMRKVTYDEVTNAYDSIFRKLQVPFIRVESDGSDMLGHESHEYHFLSDIGEDELVLCGNCGHNMNVNLTKSKEKCQKCSSSNIDIKNGIEVGHTFSIGTIYSEKIGAAYCTQAGDSRWLELSTYGIGVTRLIGASVEALSTAEYIRWPLPLAPYSICIVPPEDRCSENALGQNIVQEMVTTLNKHIKGDLVIDNRTKFSIGRRLFLIKELGFPFVIIAGKELKSDSPKVEVIDQNEEKTYLLHPSDAVSHVLQKIFKTHCGNRLVERFLQKDVLSVGKKPKRSSNR